MSTFTIDGNIEGLHTEAHILWKIPDYFSEQKADTYYSSPDFHFLQSTWSIRIYPNGMRRENSVEFVGLYVRPEEEYERHDVLFKVGIVCGDGHLCEREGRYLRGHYFCNGQNLVSWHRFMERRILTINRFRVAPEGTLTIRLVGKPLNRKVLHKGSQTRVLNGMNALTRDFQTLLTSEQASDIKIRVKSREFRAHRLILEARSPVFAAMFRYDMKEKITNSIDIEDCDPSAFEEFLTFIYTGNLGNLSLENVCGIFFLANKYDLNDLKQICTDFMEENLCLNIVCDVLSIADKCNLVSLKKSAADLFQENKKSVMLTESWISFIKENPVLATEILVDAFP